MLYIVRPNYVKITIPLYKARNIVQISPVNRPLTRCRDFRSVRNIRLLLGVAKHLTIVGNIYFKYM